jgi:hypothetical protein
MCFRGVLERRKSESEDFRGDKRQKWKHVKQQKEKEKRKLRIKSERKRKGQSQRAVEDGELDEIG